MLRTGTLLKILLLRCLYSVEFKYVSGQVLVLHGQLATEELKLFMPLRDDGTNPNVIVDATSAFDYDATSTTTLTNKTLTAPIIGTSILDTNGSNELFKLTATWISGKMNLQ